VEVPQHFGWFEVSRPPNAIALPPDWWLERRYFCSPSCLVAQLTGDWVHEQPPGIWYAADPSVGPHRFSPVQGTRQYCLLFTGPNTVCGKEQDDLVHKEEAE
jgi:hypothetical protein